MGRFDDWARLLVEAYSMAVASGLTCRECKRAPESPIDFSQWSVMPGPALGGPKHRPKGGPFTCQRHKA